MRDADCVVLPSYYREGIPRVLLEAAAMGKPLIAADSVGTREPVRDGVNGYLVPPRDARALASAMIRVIDAGAEGRASMGRQSRLVAEREYSDRLVIARYIARIQKGTTT
jgi:glycosyltransferase involved in cell wall biosynthesis